MPRVAWSLGLHAVLALLLALGWVLPAPENTVVLRHPRPRRIVTDCPREFEKRADDHPPIVPKEFQPDPVIINDAEEVVENTHPLNRLGSKDQGDSSELVSDRPFRGRDLHISVGLNGGAGGLHGSSRSSFG